MINEAAPNCTRREFLHRSSAAGLGVGLIITSKTALGQTGAGANGLRVGLIGCGFQGEALRDASRPIGGVRFAAVCDIQGSQVNAMCSRIRASRQGTGEAGRECARYLDPKEMFAKEQELDVFNWFFGALPKSIYATASIEYQTPEHLARMYRRWISDDARDAVESGDEPTIDKAVVEKIARAEFAYEHADNLMAIYEYDTLRARWGTEAGTGDVLTSRAYYEALTTTSSQATHERFMGEDGWISLSTLNDEGLNQIHSESNADPGKWDAATKGDDPLVIRDFEQNHTPNQFEFPVKFAKESVFTPHLRNFFSTITHGGGMVCPAEVAFRSTVAMLKTFESAEKGAKLKLTPADYALPS